MNKSRLIGCLVSVSMITACGNSEPDAAGIEETEIAEASEQDACSHITQANRDVLSGQAYAYFAMYDGRLESEVYAKINRNGGTGHRAYPSSDGGCDFVFFARGIVDGSSYNVMTSCPIIATEPADYPGQLSVSEIDIENCRAA